MSSKLLSLINHLFTAVLLVVLLFACQKISEGKNFEGIKLEYPAD
ncbi:MAG TPA: hypothetical protein V6C71_15675 [Coleofasciculaceae cyanobacterium]